MSIDTEIVYVIQRFINDYLDMYELFSPRTMSNFFQLKLDNGSADEDNDTIFINDYSIPFSIRYGITKACLIFDDSSDVFKIPFYYNVDCEAESALKEAFKVSRKRGKYIEFSPKDNLCEVESKLYALSKEAGVSEFFAEEKFFITYHGIPVYKQERIKFTYAESYECDTGDWREIKDNDFAEEIMLSNAEESRGGSELLYNYNFVYNMYLYAKDKFRKLFQFLDDNDIDDLHSGNLGYSFSGAPKIFDYSGIWIRKDVVW